MKLNLGCGQKKIDGFINVDNDAGEKPDYIVDLGRHKWPWGDSSVDEAVASHVLEHLPGDEFFHFMRELYRVLKPGGTVKLSLPWPRHDIFLSDPTHVRPVMPGTMTMFSRRVHEELAKRSMSLTNFAERNGVDFSLSDLVYQFDPSVDLNDPELEWKARHLNNIIYEWHGTLTAVK